MDNYIDLAHRSSAPIGPVSDRIQCDPAAMPSLLGLLRLIVPALQTLDRYKKALFYGKDFPGPWRSHLSDTGTDNAKKALMDPINIELLHGVIGHATESGEMLEALHLAFFRGQDLDRTNLLEEIGDSLWYEAKLLRFLGSTFEQEMARNIAKLKARFPDKFTEESAINRDLTKERAALEGHEATGSGHDPSAAGHELQGRDEPILYVLADYIESGTFQGGEEDTATAGIEYGEECVVMSKEAFRRITGKDAK